MSRRPERGLTGRVRRSRTSDLTQVRRATGRTGGPKTRADLRSRGTAKRRLESRRGTQECVRHDATIQTNMLAYLLLALLLSVSLKAETHRVVPDKYYRTFA